MRGETLRDLTDDLVIEDAASELRRAEADGNPALAEWARKWGEQSIKALRDAPARRDIEDDADEIDRLNNELDGARGENLDLETKIEKLEDKVADLERQLAKVPA